MSDYYDSPAAQALLIDFWAAFGELAREIAPHVCADADIADPEAELNKDLWGYVGDHVFGMLNYSNSCSYATHTETERALFHRLEALNDRLNEIEDAA